MFVGHTGAILSDHICPVLDQFFVVVAGRVVAVAIQPIALSVIAPREIDNNLWL